MWSPKPRSLTALATLILVGALSACSPARKVQEIRMQFDPPARVVFGPEDAERWIAETREWICDGESDCFADEDYVAGNVGLPYGAEAFWRPSRSDIHRFERKLSFALEQARYEYRFDPPSPLWQYSVQYIGYVRDGVRLVYANGSCGYWPDVHERWIMAFDGGTCFFGASFDPDTGELYGPGFNGYA